MGLRLYGLSSGYMDIDAPAVSGTASGTAAIYGYSPTAPVAPVAGQIWYDSTSATVVPKFWNGTNWISFGNSAMDVITPTSVSAGGFGQIANIINGSVFYDTVSTLSVNGCFSAVYSNYYIVNSCTLSVNASDTVIFRFRTNTVDNNSAVYAWQLLDVTAAVATASRVLLQTSIPTFSSVAASIPSLTTATISNPFATSPTTLQANTASSLATAQGRMGWGTFNAPASFDGFTITPTTGTSRLSGKLTIYGMKG